MKNIVNIEEWDRREEYLFFKTFQDPSISVTVEVDCTIACRKAKEQDVPVSLYYMHAALVAVNRVPEFRYREELGQVVFYDRVGLIAPILAKDNNYRTVIIPYKEKLNDFLAEAMLIVEKAKQGEGCRHGDGEERSDLVLISVVPWFRFTGIQLSIPADPHRSFPIFTFGQLTEVDGKRMMPVALRVNHGFVDGFRIGRFLRVFQQMLNR